MQKVLGCFQERLAYSEEPMEDLAGEKEMILKKSKSNTLRSWRLKDGTINPLFHKIKSRFPIPARQYFAGIWDGDGHSNLRRQKSQYRKTVHLQLEMAQNGCEPVIMLSKIFDLSLRRKIRKGERYKNNQPSYRVDLGGPKAEMFMLLIYPYLIEDKQWIREILLAKNCPEHMLQEELTFSWPYLAGYADAEGHYRMYLRHDKQKHKNGYSICSSYRFHFSLSSTDFTSLTFIKNKIIGKGFKFNKDYIRRYENTKVREGTNPKKWKPGLDIALKGGPKELSRFYKNFYFYSLIKKKRNIMEKTMEYSEIIHRQ
jgi:hypothetical protein